MSREIKLRGINTAFRNGIEIDNVCTIDWMHDEVYFENGTDVSTSIEDAKLMQYTGLKDKNGAEIYEGDVVKCRVRSGAAMTRCIGEVKFSTTYCSFVAAGVKQYFGRKPNLHELYMIEVIGNIHQNPELLEK